ncbi:unnamed protein product [Arctogadus glacialis]
MFWSKIAVEENQSVTVRPGRKARRRGRDPGLQDMFLYAHAAKGETGSLNIDKSVCQRGRDWKDWKKPMATGRGYRIWKEEEDGRARSTSSSLPERWNTVGLIAALHQ